MIYSEGIHITDIGEAYPDPSKLSVEQLVQTQKNFPLNGRIYQAPVGLSDDGGIEELEQRLSLEALVNRSLRTGLTFRERQVVALKSGLNGRGPHTENEIAEKMGLSPNQVAQVRVTARVKMAPRVYSPLFDVLDRGEPKSLTKLRRASNE